MPLRLPLSPKFISPARINLPLDVSTRLSPRFPSLDMSQPVPPAVYPILVNGAIYPILVNGASVFLVEQAKNRRVILDSFSSLLPPTHQQSLSALP